MNQLYFMLGMGSLLLLLFVGALVFRTVSSFAGQPDQQHAPSAQMLPLPGLSFPHGRLLLHRADYEFLLSGPSVAGLARELLRDRKRLVNLWLRALQKDVLTLWRYRRLLLQHGASAPLAEEVSVVFSAVSMLGTLWFLRLGVVLVGPFILVDILRIAPNPVEFIRHTCFQLASKLPEARFSEVRSAWHAA